MPAPMPPPGGPPQGPPPSAPDQQGPPDQGGQDGGAISKLLINVDQAIDHLNMVIGQSKAASPEEKQMITQVDQIYGKLMDSLGVGSGGEPDDGPPGAGMGQTVPPEAGGNKGAIPHGM